MTEDQKKTLLQKAISSKKKKQPTKEDLDLALAYFQNKINLAQVQSAINSPKGVKVYVFLVQTIKHFVKDNKLKLSTADVDNYPDIS